MSSENDDEPSGRWVRMSRARPPTKAQVRPDFEAADDGRDDTEDEDGVRDGVADLQVWDNGELNERGHHGERRGDGELHLAFDPRLTSRRSGPDVWRPRRRSDSKLARQYPMGPRNGQSSKAGRSRRPRWHPIGLCDRVRPRVPDRDDAKPSFHVKRDARDAETCGAHASVSRATRSRPTPIEWPVSVGRHHRVRIGPRDRGIGASDARIRR